MSTISVSGLAKREMTFFTDFMPESKTVIALLHHVKTEEEWTWYATDDGGERCEADDHLRSLCLEVKNQLAREGHTSKLVPYPEKSGLQFRFVAQAASLGTIGTNAFLFHPAWGPWVHLRVMTTTATLDIEPLLSGHELCDQCGICISECPAGAISAEGFKGLQCRSYRKNRGEYEPYGPKGEYRYCITCALVCPQGKQPTPRDRGVEQKYEH